MSGFDGDEDDLVPVWDVGMEDEMARVMIMKRMVVGHVMRYPGEVVEVEEEGQARTDRDEMDGVDEVDDEVEGIEGNGGTEGTGGTGVTKGSRSRARGRRK